MKDLNFQELCDFYISNKYYETDSFCQLYYNYSDLNLNTFNFFSFLQGLLNWNNCFTELCEKYSSNIYYLAGQEIKKRKFLTTPIFCITSEPEYVRKFKNRSDLPFEVIQKLNSFPISYLKNK